MGSQWIHNLVTMADAVLITAEEARMKGQCCRFCGARVVDGLEDHDPECPVTLASRVVDQASRIPSRAS